MSAHFGSGSRIRFGFMAAAAIGGMLLFGCNDDDANGGGSNDAAQNVVYVLSNVPTSGQNSILGYRRAADGSLTALAGSPFLTGGTGTGNPTQKLGPDDVDTPLVVSSDHRRLFAVNPGSNTIAVMTIAPDGSLSAVAGSPFPSGGINPGSLALAGDRLWVLNKSDDPAQPTSQLPNYTAFNISAAGVLTPVAGSTANAIAASSPQLVLLSPSKNVLFGADFMAPATPSKVGALRAFSISAAGALTAAPGTPMDIPGPADPMTHVVLGLAVHPTQNILYVGFVGQSKLGVYRFDPTSGALTFQTSVANSGKALCWVITNASGTAAYTTNTATNSVSWYNTSNALAPVESQHLVLKETGPTYTDAMGMMHITSEAYQLALDPLGKNLYVVSQHTNPDFTVTNGNLLHVLTVGTDGSLTEPGAPIHLPVATTTRPWGVVAF